MLERVQSYLGATKYTGPVSLCCDDTKLNPVLSPYWDKTRKKYFIVGVAGDPIEVADEKALTEVLQSGKLEKATKVRE